MDYVEQYSTLLNWSIAPMTAAVAFIVYKVIRYLKSSHTQTCANDLRISMGFAAFSGSLMTIVTSIWALMALLPWKDDVPEQYDDLAAIQYGIDKFLLLVGAIGGLLISIGFIVSISLFAVIWRNQHLIDWFYDFKDWFQNHARKSNEQSADA